MSAIAYGRLYVVSDLQNTAKVPSPPQRKRNSRTDCYLYRIQRVKQLPLVTRSSEPNVTEALLRRYITTDCRAL